MKKLLNIVSVLTLSISPPLLVMGCDGGNNNRPEIEPEPVINPIVKFASYKDFLQANTFLFEPNLDEDYSCMWNCPKDWITEAFNDNNLNYWSTSESYWEQFKENILNNLDNAKLLMEKSELLATTRQKYDFVDAAGEYIFPKLAKKVDEKIHNDNTMPDGYVINFYESLIPVASHNISEMGDYPYYTVIHTEEDDSLTYKHNKFIQFDTIKQSLLWDIKPNVAGQNIERYYMGNNIDDELLNFYERTCDMPWLECTD